MNPPSLCFFLGLISSFIVVLLLLLFSLMDNFFSSNFDPTHLVKSSIHENPTTHREAIHRILFLHFQYVALAEIYNAIEELATFVF